MKNAYIRAIIFAKPASGRRLSDAAATDFRDACQDIENAAFDGKTVTYNYIIDPGSGRSSTFSGMAADENVADAQKYGRAMRG
ncbi:MAG: hypothetical protein ACOYID_02620 [Eubacteriales bacterium]|jgi:hypothetical protein|nr:hypothetical protein [Clostridiales bacterium]